MQHLNYAPKSMNSARMEPETLIHHLVSPICILCATQTDVDYRLLCQLSLCIDLSGAVLGLSKFFLRFSHLSAKRIYQPPACHLRVSLQHVIILIRKGLLTDLYKNPVDLQAYVISHQFKATLNGP